MIYDSTVRQVAQAIERVAKAIEHHGEASIIAAKIAANASARAAGNRPIHEDVPGGHR